MRRIRIMIPQTIVVDDTNKRYFACHYECDHLDEPREVVCRLFHEELNTIETAPDSRVIERCAECVKATGEDGG